MKHIKKSLQQLKNDLSHKERLFKAIHTHYPHLSSLEEKELLAYFQVTTLDELEIHFHNTIDRSSTKNNNEEDHCTCKDSSGEFKELYETDTVAQRQAERSMMQHNVRLKVYPCPYGYGWHLTKA